MTPRIRRLAAVIAVAVLGLSPGGCGGSPSAASVAPIQVYDAGKRAAAPDLTGTLLDGGSFRLADHKGEVVVLNFWASWCPPCRVEADDLERSYQATRTDRVTFLGVNIRDQRDAANKAVAAGKISYPSVFDPSSSLALLFDVPPATIPATIVIDREGRIAAVARRAVLDAELTPLINEISRG
jgi:peroxiredoxin